MAIAVLGVGVGLLIQFLTFEQSGIVRIAGSIGFVVLIVIGGRAIGAVVRHEREKRHD
ncbi:putative transporter [Clavibacter michiganensis]|nr:putative transporter [Clavibacter michiganensis]